MAVDKELYPDYYRAVCTHLGTRIADRIRKKFPSLSKGQRTRIATALDRVCWLTDKEEGRKYGWSRHGKAEIAAIMYLIKCTFLYLEDERRKL